MSDPQYIVPHSGQHDLLIKTPATAKWLLAVVNGHEAHDFKFFLARRRRDFNFIADFFVQQRNDGDVLCAGVAIYYSSWRSSTFCSEANKVTCAETKVGDKLEGKHGVPR
jgi:hypothetical protein